MDPHETTNSPHPHHDQLENVILVEPNPFTNTTQTTIMEPITAQLSPIIMNANLSPNYEPIVNNIVPSSLNPSISVSSDTESIKRKRGRPRKHFPIGNIASSLGSDPGPTQASIATSPSSSTGKKSTSGRGRGRPRGSFKKKHLVETHGVTESCFSPHVIFVNQGKDIIAKVTAFSQAVAGPNIEICILSAHGLVDTVALHHLGSIVNYKGQFEIVSLSGNLEVSDNNYGNKRMSYFKVSLVNPDSRLLIGVVADKLIAASLVKVIVGSFTLDGKKNGLNNLKYEPSSASLSQLVAFGTPTNATTHGPSSESLGVNENNLFCQRPEIYNKIIQPIPTMSMYQQP